MKIDYMLLMGAGGALIIAASFFGTLRFLDEREGLNPGSEPPETPQIHLVEASYGLNCGTKATAGNVTQAMTQACASKNETCSFLIDVTKIGDPAPGCGKALVAKWKCGTGRKVHEKQQEPEANGQIITIECPSK